MGQFRLADREDACQGGNHASEGEVAAGPSEAKAAVESEARKNACRPARPAVEAKRRRYAPYDRCETGRYKRTVSKRSFHEGRLLDCKRT